MSTVFDLVKGAGSIPLDELTVLSSSSEESVKQEVDELQREGLVTVEGEAETEEPPVVTLTHLGYRRALK